MVIVSDTSVITNLYQIGQLDLLQDLYETVIIPVAVNEELSALPEQGEHIATLSWIEVQHPKDRTEVSRLMIEEALDLGESEAIVLAKELGADVLIIDESKGRVTADRQGLKIVGTFGVLVRAKQEGLIQEVRPLVKDLLNVGFRLQRQLINRVLTAIGEQSL